MSQPDLNPPAAPEHAAQSAAGEQNVCPRCRHTAVTQIDAPDGSGVWSISTCVHCCFSWRSPEEVMHVLEITTGKIYRLWDSDIERLPMPVPMV